MSEPSFRRSWALEPDLRGFRAMVTGAGSGIGLATVALLARCGASVQATHLPGDTAAAERLSGIAGDIGTVAFDVADPEATASMTEVAAGRLGGLDLLVNNAATPATSQPIPYDDFEAMTEARWQRILDVNLIGPFRCTRAARPHLAVGGAVVNVASVAGLGGNASSLAYGAGKAGLINLTRNLARALGPGVRVNAVAPGLTETAWVQSWPEARKARSVAATDLGRMVQPEEVASAILFLALHPAITGQVLAVDCGRNF